MILKQQTLSPGPLILVPFLIVMTAAMGFLTLQGMEIYGLMAILAVLGAVIIILQPQLGIVILLTSFFVTYGKYLPTEGRFTPNNLLGLLFVVLLLLKLYRERDLWFLKEKAIQVFILLIILFLISSRFAEQQTTYVIPELDQTGRMLHNLITRFIFLVFFVNFIRTVRDVKLVIWVVLGLILVSGVSGMQASLGGTNPGEYRAAAQVGIQSAGNANRLAFMCVLGIAILWYFRQAVRSRLLSLLLIGLVPYLAVTTLMTGSRSGLLNLIILFFLIAMEGRFNIKRQVQVALAAITVAYLAAYFLTSTHVERLENLVPGASIEVKGTSSTEKRLRTLENGLKMVIEDPFFGIGIGNFMSNHLRVSGGAAKGSAHNSYLWAAAEGGVPVLLLYLILYGSTFKSLLQVERKSGHAELRLIARGLRTGLSAFLIFSFFADFWLNILMYMLVGLAIALRRVQESESAIVFDKGTEPPIPGYTTGVKSQTTPA